MVAAGAAVGALFDAHVHVWSDPPPAPDALTSSFRGDRTALFAALDAAGVAGCCVVTPLAMAGDESATRSVARQHADRVIPMARAQPPTPGRGWWQPGDPDWAVRLDIRGLDPADERVPSLLRFVETIPRPLALHADAGQRSLLRRIVALRLDRWTLIDHLGRPYVELPPQEAIGAVLALAQNELVAIKTPNLPHFSARPAPFEDLWAPIAAVLHAFGPDRLVWGSDWPLCTEGGSYPEQVEAMREILEAIGARDSIPQVMGGNARRILAS